MRENVLERHPDADLRVYATNYWDNERRTEERFAEGGGAAYDFFYVYGPDAKWGDEPAATGAPVVVEADKLDRALRPYLQ